MVASALNSGVNDSGPSESESESEIGSRSESEFVSKSEEEEDEEDIGRYENIEFFSFQWGFFLSDLEDALVSRTDELEVGFENDFKFELSVFLLLLGCAEDV